MRAVVIYESMFGGTKAVAEAVASVLSSRMEVEVRRAVDAALPGLEPVDLLVLGAPTHAHGLPRPSTRQGTPGYVEKSGAELVLEPEADSAPGVREWLAGSGTLRMSAAAFDTRAGGPRFLTGSAAQAIARTLKKHGATLVAAPESFVTSRHKLVPGELDRASAWGEGLAERVFFHSRGGAEQTPTP